MIVYECENCGKEFEEEETENITCPYCHSNDVISYKEEEE